MLRKLGLGAVAVAAPVILLLCFVEVPGADVAFALLVAAFPVFLIAMAAPGSGSAPAFVLPLAALLVLLVGGVTGMLLLRGATDSWIGGLPAALAIQLFVLFLAPLAVVSLAYGLGFERFRAIEGDARPPPTRAWRRSWHGRRRGRGGRPAPSAGSEGLMPLFEKPWIVGSAIAYLAVMVAVGLWAGRRTKTAKDFFIAGQGIGLVVTALATMSAAFSGFVFLGGPGLTYRIGVASLFICIPVSFTAGLLCWVLAKRLRLLAEVREVFTIPDALYCRYRSRLAAGLGAVAVVLGTIGYLGAQILAMGVLIESIFGTRALLGDNSLAVSMAIGLAVVLVYSIVGGMVAGVYTNLVQGLVMVVAAVAVFQRALEASGGWATLTREIAASEAFGPAFLDPFGKVPILTAMGFFFVFGIGNLGQPHILHKFYMLDDPRKLKWMPLVVGSTQVLCVLIWLGIGLAVPALVATGELAPLARPDDASPTFLLEVAPELLAGMVFAGILAAIMSTADSFLNIASAALVRDLPRALGRPLADELRWGRVAVVGVALVSAPFAYAYGDLIALLGTFAFGTFGAALAPALAVGLNWRRVTRSAAVASIATGMVLNLGLEFLARQEFFPLLPKPPLAAGALPTAVSLAASFTVLVVVTLWTSRRGAEDLDADVAAVMEA